MDYIHSMARTDPQVNFRLPHDLRNQLRDAAINNNRTLTSEIVARLQQSFEQQDRERYESSPEYFEGLEQAARESMPNAPGRSLAEHLAEKRADKEADLVADKVVSKLISTEEFIEKIQRAILDGSRKLDGTRTLDNDPKK